MNDKLEILCKQLQLSEEEKNHFQGGLLNRIIGNHGHDEYRFYIHLDHTLPLDLYLSFQEKLRAAFPTCRTVSASFQVEKPSAELFLIYFKHFLEEL